MYDSTPFIETLLFFPQLVLTPQNPQGDSFTIPLEVKIGTQDSRTRKHSLDLTNTHLSTTTASTVLVRESHTSDPLLGSRSDIDSPQPEEMLRASVPSGIWDCVQEEEGGYWLWRGGGCISVVEQRMGLVYCCSNCSSSLSSRSGCCRCFVSLLFFLPFLLLIILLLILSLFLPSFLPSFLPRSFLPYFLPSFLLS